MSEILKILNKKINQSREKFRKKDKTMNEKELKEYEILFPELKKYSKKDLEKLILKLNNLDWSNISEHEIKEQEYANYLLKQLL